MNDLEFLVFVPIAGICLFIGAALKAIGNETLKKFIPTLCAVSGSILSILAFYTIPNFIPANNWLEALWIGVGSGLAATGLHQVYKQFTEAKEPGVLIPINDDKVDTDENEGEDVEDFEETLKEGEGS